MTHLRYALSVAAVLAAGTASAEPCKLTAIGDVEVAAVRDGRTLALRDGSEVRLTGIEAPEGTQGAAAKAALDRLVAVGPLALKRLGSEERDATGGSLPSPIRRAQPSRSRKRCWLKAMRGCRPGSATRPAPTHY
jgi:endonuclease YncB( thermonuclease family)